MDAVLKEQKTKEDMKAGIESDNGGRLTLILCIALICILIEQRNTLS